MSLSIALTLLVTIGAPAEETLPKPARVKVTVSRIRSSLVTIRIVQTQEKPGELPRGPSVLGAIVGPQGLLLAPRLEAPADAKLEGVLSDKSKVAVKRLSTDAKLGVDLFQLSTDKKLVPLPLVASDKLEICDLAMVINPIGDGQIIVTAGIVFAKSRDFVAKENSLQFDCATGPGAPHALAFDGAGRVVGVMVQDAEKRSNGLAYPGEMLKSVVEKEIARLRAP